MQEVSVVIPNFNGMAYLDGVLSSLERQTIRNFEVILVDNGSTDGSCAFVSAEYPWVHMIQLPENYGFSRAVNEGIRAARSPYVLLLNNDTEAEPDFLEEMVAALRRHKKAFSCQAKMIQLHDRDKMDDAGNYYCALGWAFARGKGKDISHYDREQKIFSTCAGAAIYRKKFIDRIGDFDEEHFAYLEDLDIGYRARICGYQNWYAPKAKVYHVGSGTSGSRYNSFKVRLAARNNVYLNYKNMPLFQLVLNGLPLGLGILVKYAFFRKIGFGKDYIDGLKEGFKTAKQCRKVKYDKKHLKNYLAIEWGLCTGTLLYIREFLARQAAKL